MLAKPYLLEDIENEETGYSRQLGRGWFRFLRPRRIHQHAPIYIQNSGEIK
jgi:hypothetical protein